MYYLQSRYYDPNIGRFLNADAFASTGQGLLGNNMFAYCGNNPVCRSDHTGAYYTSGQIHNFVVEDICANNPNKTGDNSYIKYFNPILKGRKKHTYGFCDVYDTVTHEVWEVKRLSSAYSCTPTAAATQLGNYVLRGFLKNRSDWELKFGGTYTSIEPNIFIKPDKNGGTYVIGYADFGNGLVYYDYVYIPSLAEATMIVSAIVGLMGIYYGMWDYHDSPVPIFKPA